MPVSLIVGRESPFHSCHSQARVDVGVVGYVAIIVVVEESIVSDAVVGHQHGQRQQQTEQKSPSPGRQKQL